MSTNRKEKSPFHASAVRIIYNPFSFDKIYILIHHILIIRLTHSAYRIYSRVYYSTTKLCVSKNWINDFVTRLIVKKGVI